MSFEEEQAARRERKDHDVRTLHPEEKEEDRSWVDDQLPEVTWKVSFQSSFQI